MKTRIQKLREERKLTQTGLAIQIGTTQSTLSKIENGTRVPDAGLLLLIADFFHVSIDYLLCLSNVRLTLEVQCSQPGISGKYLRLLTFYHNLSNRQKNTLNAFLESLSDSDRLTV